jgi:transposase
MKNITVIGVDIAKNFMQIHGQDKSGKPVLVKRLKRERFLAYMANTPKCLIGMEACSGAHYWARELIKLGFEVKLMSPRKVKKYVDNQKNDANDAKACAEAVTRASMTFVPIKTLRQQDTQMCHRVRSSYVRHRTSLMNMVRGLLLEMGIAIPRGKAALIAKLQELTAENALLSREISGLLRGLYENLQQVEQDIKQQTELLENMARDDEHCQRLCTLPGVGPLTATAIVAKIGNGSEFKRGRELSAYLGLVPKQHSSGEKQRLLGISKHGDRYVRQLLIHGGRAATKAALRKNKETGIYEKQDAHSQWIQRLVERVGINKTSVAVANKNARMMVVLLKNETTFQPAWAHTMYQPDLCAA